MQKPLLLILTLLLTCLPQPLFGQATQTLAPATGAPTTLGPLAGTDGSPLDGVSANPALSADGNVIIFAARATNLLGADAVDPRFDFWQIYAYDRAQDAMTRVSSGPGGQPGNGSSGGSPPVVAADGNLVAFASRAGNLVFGDSNDVADIFVYDRAAAQMTRVSVTSAGGQGNRDSYLPVIAADGHVVAFVSQASTLVAGDTNNAADVFVHDRRTGQTQRVSVSGTGTQANGASGLAAPALSADGRYVAFASPANNLVAGDTNDAADVFIHDRQTGHTQRVSVSSAGAQADGASTAPALSGDGRYVAFLSAAPNLTAPNLASGDTSGQTHVYLHDRQTGTTVRISTTHDGAPANGQAFAPTLSTDGRYVAFAALADNLVPGDSNQVVDIFLHDGLSGQIERVSLTAAGGQSNGLAWRPALGGYGRYVAFEANASNLTPTDAPTRNAIYLRDRGAQATGAYTLTGQILGLDDEPVSGLSVQVGLRFPRQTQTDSAGRFDVRNLPAGDYRVAIDTPNYLLDPPLPQTVTVGETDATTLNIRAYPCVGPVGLNLCALRAGDILLALTPHGADWPQVGGTYFTRAALYAGLTENGPRVVEITPAQDTSQAESTDIVGTRALTATAWWTGEGVLDWAVVRPPVSATVARNAAEAGRALAADGAIRYGLFAADGFTPIAPDDPIYYYTGKLIAAAYTQAGHTLVPGQRATPTPLAGWITPDDLYWHNTQVQRQAHTPDAPSLFVWAEGAVHLALIGTDDTDARAEPNPLRLGYRPTDATTPATLPYLYSSADARVSSLAAAHLDTRRTWEVEITARTEGAFVLGWRTMTPDGTVTLNGGSLRAGEVRTWPLTELADRSGTLFMPTLAR